MYVVDWEKQQAVCPEGKISSSWSEAITKTGKRMIKVKFATTDCQVCPVRTDCTKSKFVRRTLSLLPLEQHKIQQRARERGKTAEYKREYRRRWGIEGTISQAVRGFGMRQSRYIGAVKTQLHNLITATAVNLVRINNWLHEIPIAKTRKPLFVRVMEQMTS